MTEQTNPQPTVRNLSRPEQRQRFALAWPWWLGLITVNLVGVLLVSMIIFALVPVAHAMNLAQPLKPMPTPTSTATLMPTPTVTPTPEPVQPVAIDPSSIPAVVWDDTPFTLRGAAAPGAMVFIYSNGQNPNGEEQRGFGATNANGQWTINIQFDFDYTKTYWVQARILNSGVSNESAQFSITVSAPSPTPTNTPTNTPTPATEAGPTATPTPAGGV